MQIQISWLQKKPTDLDLHCLQRKGTSGFSRTRVNMLHDHILKKCNCPETTNKTLKHRNVYKVYVHVRLINAATAWLGLHPLQLQQRANNPIMSDSRLLAMATDINPCTALYQSETKMTNFIYMHMQSL